MIEERKQEANYYEDDSDYYYNNALKVNIKQDSGAARIGRIPVWKLKLENESEIPEKPKDILPEPNRKPVDKQLKEIDDQIAYHRKSIEELKEKIKAERFGNNPEITKLTADKDQFKAQREPVLAEIIELENKIKGPKEQLGRLKSEKESLQKELEFYKVEQLDAEIRSIQHKLGFSSLSVGEEKKMIDRKNRIEPQRPKVARYAEVVKLMKTIHDSNDAVFAKLKVLNDTKRNLNEKVKTLSTKLKSFLDNKKQNDPNIKNLEGQRDNIRAEIDKCFEKKREINAEFDDKVYYYREQQKLLKYIKEAEEKISQMKKFQEREKKRKEREAKENAESQPLETTTKVEEEPFAYEIWVCQWLTNYFKNTLGVKETVQVATQEKKTVNSKIDEDISKGLIKVMTRPDDGLEIGLTSSSSAGTKKKSKGPKVSKREQKAESSGLLSLDISIIKKIQDLKLSPPAKKAELPAFIEMLQKTHDELQNQAESLKKGSNANADAGFTPTPTQTPIQTPVQQTQEEVKEEPKLISETTENVVPIKLNPKDGDYEEVEVTEEVEEEVEDK